MIHVRTKLLQALPELLQKYNNNIVLTKSLIENNDSHFYDQVYLHLLKTTYDLAQLISMSKSEYFRATIGKHTKKELFLLATLFHDVGKLTTIRKDKEGITCSPGHEDASADYILNVLDNNEFTTDELAYIETIVRKHSTTNKILNLPEKETNQAFTDLSKTESALYLELLMFGMADNLGADMGLLNPMRFSRRLAIIREKIMDVLR